MSLKSLQFDLNTCSFKNREFKMRQESTKEIRQSQQSDIKQSIKRNQVYSYIGNDQHSFRQGALMNEDNIVQKTLINLNKCDKSRNMSINYNDQSMRSNRLQDFKMHIDNDKDFCNVKLERLKQEQEMNIKNQQKKSRFLKQQNDDYRLDSFQFSLEQQLKSLNQKPTPSLIQTQHQFNDENFFQFEQNLQNCQNNQEMIKNHHHNLKDQVKSIQISIENQAKRSQENLNESQDLPCFYTLNNDQEKQNLAQQNITQSGKTLLNEFQNNENLFQQIQMKQKDLDSKLNNLYNIEFKDKDDLENPFKLSDISANDQTKQQQEVNEILQNIRNRRNQLKNN